MTLAPELSANVDSLTTEPSDIWTARVPAKYRAKVPQEPPRGVAETWMLHDERLAPIGVTAMAGWPPFSPGYPYRIGQPTAAWRAAARAAR
ncbi:hypothetical protein Franean1_4635 [Parafrankia sp. EAN1pec]|uniref:hypothetical protein n=1 Tax=Parafrankia sp. (strain EAN1pec) TaxID=298653 RepID=UPI0000541222|nr:hypothetical protein Franean1_4635 [Frankia sp. EAN1pec]